MRLAPCPHAIHGAQDPVFLVVLKYHQTPNGPPASPALGHELGPNGAARVGGQGVAIRFEMLLNRGKMPLPQTILVKGL